VITIDRNTHSTEMGREAHLDSVKLTMPLRHICATLALEAGVPIAELKFLLNHAVSSGGVTMGYLHPSLEHLAEWQE
jgi:hypothetical protein